ncbi:hypothetical protein PPL_05731 [Heterostelium album PN500]|uniref:Uncharacterized protein n=1 Tax=Heterostelium pallidum (strain ATCC 26659 / Pp 5 / PN500) TaxID=670386 RepID=D3BB00_HETP5|nr:hypothetical protein PPL_05731 [Heterostelium album PN500]EFA81737.1 hypothetical protein PPL_05731 [Heterostelium album PN500]|eukprot:XP_020433854.1 hypothetical protein PPL_05731 [Heterostelium album PN500]
MKSLRVVSSLSSTFLLQQSSSRTTQSFRLTTLANNIQRYSTSSTFRVNNPIFNSSSNNNRNNPAMSKAGVTEENASS